MYTQGIPFYHNGTALFGWRWADYLNDPNGLLTLADRIPPNLPILIEEADIHPATRQTDDPTHDETIAMALQALAEKSCYLMLTTVQGNESLISKALLENVYEHVTPRMNVETAEELALETVHRYGNRLIPTHTIQHDREFVYKAMALADTFKPTRSRATDGSPVRYTEDRLIPVVQRSIDEMKYPLHPENPVHYRYRVIQNIGGRIVHQLTKESLLFFTWLESVNEHLHETVVLELLERAMPQWGFEYEVVPVPQNDRFPDGKALIDGKATNLEVVSIQPRFPGRHSLHDLVALSQAGRAIHPESGPILDCRTCRRTALLPEATLEDIPYHDESHLWVIYLPMSEPETGIDYDLTITPPITITQGDFIDELKKSIQVKSRKIAIQGVGQDSWVIVLAQGFPVDPQWYHVLPVEWPANVDGIVIVATETYLGAHHDFLPYNDLTLVLLKCSAGDKEHRCYHPSYGYRIARLDQNLNPISRNTHSVEELAYPTFNHLWPPSTIKRTLVLRNESEQELGHYEDVIITPLQVEQALAELGYEWKIRRRTLMTLQSEEPDETTDCWAEIRRLEASNTHIWVATIYLGSEQLRENFTRIEDAKRWCEGQIAVTKLTES